ncbi:MAG: hypothetical protein LBS92_05025 [Candidatus Methanoplasma sp.]|nr:hypothetical protein [Candidatus Methanoplasma sp.]
MNADPMFAPCVGMYDFKKKEDVPLDKCVERGLMTQERYEEIVRSNAKGDACARAYYGSSP